MNWRYRNSFLVLCTSAFFVTMVARLAISPLTPLVIDEFGISTSLIGLSLTGMWLAYALTHLPSGVLGEQYAERRIIPLSIGGISVMSILLGLTPVFALFAVCCILLGDSRVCITPRRRHCSRGRSTEQVG